MRTTNQTRFQKNTIKMEMLLNKIKSSQKDQNGVKFQLKKSDFVKMPKRKTRKLRIGQRHVVLAYCQLDKRWQICSEKWCTTDEARIPCISFNCQIVLNTRPLCRETATRITGGTLHVRRPLKNSLSRAARNLTARNVSDTRQFAVDESCLRWKDRTCK